MGLIFDREYYMRRALELAQESFLSAEVPVGCVIADGSGKIIAEGKNRRISQKSALSHAEIEAISKANDALGDWRLTECTLYVTLEPCPMCAGAIINARIPVVVYGAKEQNSGCCGSVINLFEENFGHRCAIFGGVLETECAELMRRFFEQRRKNGDITLLF